MTKKLYVGNLSFKADEEGIRAFFGAEGYTVVQVSIASDRETGRSRGFAFVEFEDETQAAAARESMDGKPFLGRPLRLDLARERESRGPRRPGPPEWRGGGRPDRYGGGPRFDRDGGGGTERDGGGGRFDRGGGRFERDGGGPRGPTGDRSDRAGPPDRDRGAHNRDDRDRGAYGRDRGAHGRDDRDRSAYGRDRGDRASRDDRFRERPEGNETRPRNPPPVDSLEARIAAYRADAVDGDSGGSRGRKRGKKRGAGPGSGPSSDVDVDDDISRRKETRRSRRDRNRSRGDWD